MKLAIDGGQPVRTSPLPYARPWVDEDDRAAVLEVLHSDFLTTGPRVPDLEERFAAFAGARHAVAFSSGTAALHGAAFAAGLGAGDEAVVASLSFVASANAIAYTGARPVFADVARPGLAATAETLERAIGPRTRALVPVDYAGHPIEHEAILALARRRGLVVIEDACHAAGAAAAGGRPVGSLADLTCFSFHPVKPIAAGEGGMVTTADEALARRLRLFRTHGLAGGDGAADQVALGMNYRLSDIHASLAAAQLGRAEAMRARREELARRYGAAFAKVGALRPAAPAPGTRSAWHLYAVEVVPERLSCDRDGFRRALAAEGILAGVHYRPIHLHTFYRERFGTGPGLCPTAEEAGARLLTLPLFARMDDRDADDAIEAVRKVVAHFGK